MRRPDETFNSSAEPAATPQRRTETTYTRGYPGLTFAVVNPMSSGFVYLLSVCVADHSNRGEGSELLMSSSGYLFSLRRTMWPDSAHFP
ncbi:unnamed protein product [Toxocara canis]|uniref:Uncharacterized protein n=1 Tax=Toxocara canis TaxID=6265 RepID=A0A183U1G7_TOXCA|nr:unnamed protein product [Toxocara canis]